MPPLVGLTPVRHVYFSLERAAERQPCYWSERSGWTRLTDATRYELAGDIAVAMVPCDAPDETSTRPSSGHWIPEAFAESRTCYMAHVVPPEGAARWQLVWAHTPQQAHELLTRLAQPQDTIRIAFAAA